MGKHLAIELSDLGAIFSLMQDGKVRDQHQLIFKSAQVASIREELSDFLASKEQLKGTSFDEITLAWSNERSTLVPSGIFSESNPKAMFSLCFGSKQAECEVDYNRISELSAVNIYEVPLWIKSFFVIRFPRIMIQHAGSHLVRKVLDENTFKLKATIFLQQDYFLMTLVRHNNLEFYSFFDAHSAEDIVYHLMFALQQKELTNEKGSVELIQGIGVATELVEDIRQALGKIQDLKKMHVALIQDYLPKAQLLCV